METSIKCNKCNIEMEYFIQGSSCGWKCPKCSDMLVTTYIDPIEEDYQVYEITIDALDIIPKEMIKIVSVKNKCNLIEAKKKLESGVTVSNLSAKEAKELLIMCKNNDIRTLVNPVFEHNID